MNPILLEPQMVINDDSDDASDHENIAIPVSDGSSDENIAILDFSDDDVQAILENVDQPQFPKKIKLSSDTESLCLPITSVMIGQHSANPISSLEILGMSISIKLPSTVLRIKWANVKLIEYSPDKNEPCLFLTLKKDYLKAFHSNLGLIPEKLPCYNPFGTDDQKYFILYIGKEWQRANPKTLLRKLRRIKGLAERPEIIKEITPEESSHRQFKAADAVVARNEEKKSLRPTPRLLQCNLRYTYAKSRPIVEKKLLDSLTTIAVYPPPPSPGGIVITNRDVTCLDSGEYVNDVIIDFYLQYLINELLPEEDRQRCHVFSSFFFKRLTQQQGENSRTQDGLSDSERRYARVRKWSRNVDIFSKDFIIIPLNESAHWYLAVICFPGEFSSRDSNPFVEERSCPPHSAQSDGSHPSPCIVIFDSLQDKESPDVSVFLRQYLSEEWRSRKAECGERIFNRRTMRCIIPSIPQQDNNSDCGLFLMHYVEKIFQIPPQHFNARIRSLGRWFDSREVKYKRLRIKKIISSLREKQSADS